MIHRKELHGIIIHPIIIQIINLGYSRLDQSLGTVQAGKMGNIDFASLEGDAFPGTIGDAVDFRMKRRDAMSITHDMADIVALWRFASYTAIIPCGDNAVVSVDDNRPYVGSVAGGPFGENLGDIHKIFVPGLPYPMGLVAFYDRIAFFFFHFLHLNINHFNMGDVVFQIRFFCGA